MSNNDVGWTEPRIEGPDVNNRKKFSFHQNFKMHPKIEKNLLLSLILVSVSLDPLFFYISVVNNHLNCLGLDNNLRIVVVVLRTFVDGLYITIWFHKLDVLPQKPHQRILSWIVAILANLPLPQSTRTSILSIAHAHAPEPQKSCRRILSWIVAILAILPLPQVFGAFWYLRAIERNMDCWKKACKSHGLCGTSSLYCDYSSSNNKYLEEFCPIPPDPNLTFFDHGIYLDAFQRDIVGSGTNFLHKLFYCFWWALQSLSSFGQNLKPSTYIWDVFFAVFIGVSGLILVAVLIGNMQVCVQKKTTIEWDRHQKAKEQLVRDRMMKRIRKSKVVKEITFWPPFHKFPQEVRKEVISCMDDRWLETTEINLESFLKNTPFRLRKDLKQHLCKDLFSKVEKFEGLVPAVKEQLRMGAKPVVYQAKTIIHKEGYPVHEMIHIVQGKVLVFNKGNGKKEGLPFHSYKLTKNDSFGKELMDKAFESPLPNLPLATETVQSLTKVEAFALSYDDIVDMLSKHGYLSRSNQEDWAANVIANAIRRRAAFRMVAEPSVN